MKFTALIKIKNNLLCHVLHTMVRWRASVIKKEWPFPMIIVCLQDVPRIVRTNVPYVKSFLS